MGTLTPIATDDITLRHLLIDGDDRALAEAYALPFRYDPSTLEGLVVTAADAAGVVVSDGPAVAAWFDA